MGHDKKTLGKAIQDEGLCSAKAQREATEILSMRSRDNLQDDNLELES